MTRVVDTSVVVKWFVAEEGQDLAEKLIGEALIAPELLLAEVTNVAWKKWRRQEISREQAAAAQQLVTSVVELVPAMHHAERALEIALELAHPAYDCFYLALCEALDLTLVTADQRLIAACRGTAMAERIEALT